MSVGRVRKSGDASLQLRRTITQRQPARRVKQGSERLREWFGKVANTAVISLRVFPFPLLLSTAGSRDLRVSAAAVLVGHVSALLHIER
jgi:hypothetical protein